MTVKYEAVKIEEGTETARWINSCRTSTTPNRSQGRCTPDNTVIVCIHSHTYTVRGRTLGSTKHSSGSTTEFWGLWKNTWCVYSKDTTKRRLVAIVPPRTVNLWRCLRCMYRRRFSF